jgi:hypothetical protein
VAAGDITDVVGGLTVEPADFFGGPELIDELAADEAGRFAAGGDPAVGRQVVANAVPIDFGVV